MRHAFTFVLGLECMFMHVPDLASPYFEKKNDLNVIFLPIFSSLSIFLNI